MNKKKAFILGFDAILVILLLAFDQFTKQLAVIHLKGQLGISLIKGILELQYLENRGAAFGILENKKTFIILIGIIFMVVLIFFLYRLPQQKKYNIVHILVAVIMAGGLGNMIDRIRLNYVIDFIYFSLIDFPTFNVADMYVVVSTISIFILFLFVYKDEDFTFLSLKKRNGSAL